MDNKFRITVTDRETGARADQNGVPGQVDTDLGLICALGGRSEAADAFFCAILANHDRGVSVKELAHLADAVFHSFGAMGRDGDGPNLARDVFSIVTLAFTKYVRSEIPDAARRAALYSGLALFEHEEAAEAAEK